jgi:Ca2+-binding RTX toxin-like protein
MIGHAQGGDDRLFGGTGNDSLVGDASEMSDNSRSGDDWLDGGAGDDQLWGDATGIGDVRVTRGADRFVFAHGSEHDTILDFEDSKDRIDLTGYRGIDSFAEVRAHASQGEEGTVIDLSAAAGGQAGEDVLTLRGIALTTLDARDFLFA